MNRLQKGQEAVSVLVVGSIAFDSVKTPFGSAREVLGGSATYFSLAASYFTPVHVVGVVGEDFGEEHLDVFRQRGVDLQGIERAQGKTFRWSGVYSYDLNERDTLDTQLNVFADFGPRIPESYRDASYIFLGNIDPDLQRDVLQQVRSPRFVALDTMNYWIENKRDSLLHTLSAVHLLTINDGEARQLTEEVNLVKAARKILALGPRILIIKRGEYGALMFSDSTVFSAPGYPLEFVYDPTGAGDTFAGGLCGYLANLDNVCDDTLRQAIIFGSAMASFCVEDFSVRRLQNLSYPDILARYRDFLRLTRFDDVS